MASSPTRNPERTEDMLALYKEGLSYAQIGERYGITKQGVAYLLTRHPDHKPRPRGAAR